MSTRKPPGREREREKGCMRETETEGKRTSARYRECERGAERVRQGVGKRGKERETETEREVNVWYYGNVLPPVTRGLLK